MEDRWNESMVVKEALELVWHRLGWHIFGGDCVALSGLRILVAGIHGSWLSMTLHEPTHLPPD